MIGYQDFFPTVTEQGGFLKEAKYEALKETLKRANEWIDEHGVDVMNIETVVLPNIHHPHEGGTEDSNLHSMGDHATFWHQFFRVWYRYSSPVP